MQAGFAFLSFQSREVHLGIGFAVPSEFAMMLRLMRAVTFDAFGALDSA